VIRAEAVGYSLSLYVKLVRRRKTAVVLANEQNISYFKTEEMSILKSHYCNGRDLQEQK